MTNRNVYSMPVAAAAMAAIILAIFSWMAEPARGVMWAGLIAGLFVAAVSPLLIFRKRTESAAVTRKNIERGLFGALLMFVGVLGLDLAAETGAIDYAASKRVGGVIIGVVLAISGNILPKIVTPLSLRKCDDSRAKATERFAGWAFVLAGIAYAAIWLVAPIKDAKMLTSFVGLGAFFVVLLAWINLSLGGHNKQHGK